VALAVAGIAASATAATDPELEIPEGAVAARYLNNVDGDTITVELLNFRGEFEQVEIELIGIDAPEFSRTADAESDCYGPEARSKVDSVLVAAKNDTVWLESDIDDEAEDGALWRYVWFVSIIDQKVHFLNLDLVRDGFALAVEQEPNLAHQDELDDAERAAISAGMGLWLTCDASVSMDASLEEDGRPDRDPIDRTKVPVEDDPEAACALFDFYDEAQDLLEQFPELAEQLDPDGNGIACELFFNLK
jgi:micrococcal nuclease